MTITRHWKTIALLCVGGSAACLGAWYIYKTYSVKTKQSSEITSEVPQTPLESAVSLKNRGNKYFKAMRYEQAIECYTEALDVCPPEASTERATFHQNRGAARENMQRLDEALEDFNAALELSPRYLKALNRRAHLYEKLGRLDDCLLDVTACCIFERFLNPDNVLCVDRVLKRLGQEQAKVERPKLPKNLPSETFIQSYLSAFSWDPFLTDADKSDAVELAVIASSAKRLASPVNSLVNGDYNLLAQGENSSQSDNHVEAKSPKANHTADQSAFVDVLADGISAQANLDGTAVHSDFNHNNDDNDDDRDKSNASADKFSALEDDLLSGTPDLAGVGGSPSAVFSDAVDTSRGSVASPARGTSQATDSVKDDGKGVAGSESGGGVPAATVAAATPEARLLARADLEVEADGKGGSVVCLPEVVRAAAVALDTANMCLRTGDFKTAMQQANLGVELFDKARDEIESAEARVQGWRVPARRAAARCRLLEATFMALCGQAELAAERLLLLANAVDDDQDREGVVEEAEEETMSGRGGQRNGEAETYGTGFSASRVVKTNALIKAACLAMTVDQDIEICLAMFRRAEMLCPNCPDVYLHRGQIYLLAEQLESALADLGKAVSLQPGFSIAQSQHAYTRYRRAFVMSGGGGGSGSTSSFDDNVDVEKTVRQFARLAEQFPICQETHSLYAQVLTERGEFQQADVEFARVIELAPNSGMAYAHRGLLQLRWRQDTETAGKYFAKGVEVDPKCELVHELSGQLAVQRGDFKSALDHFSAAIQHSKTLTDLAHLLSLRAGVRAQDAACQRYGVSVAEMLGAMQQDEQQVTMMAAAAAAQQAVQSQSAY